MAGLRKLLSTVLAFILLFTSIITSTMNVYAEQVNENLQGIYDDSDEMSSLNSASLEDWQFSDIISGEKEEPQSIKDIVYLENVIPAKPKEQKEILIKYKDLNMAGNIRTKVKGELKLSKLQLKNRNKHLRLELVEIDERDDINKVLDELNNNKSVQYAQPNYLLTSNSIPSDQLFGEQWALQNVGQAVYGQAAGVAGIDIDAVNAWDITTGDTAIIVGVADTGIDINHNDISDSIYANPGEIAGNGIDDDNNGYIDDINGWDFFNQDSSVFDSAGDDTHGTQIAGIITAGMNNGGVVGIAPNVKIFPLKFINSTYGYTSDVIEAIEYAKTFGVKIMNCSWGGDEENLALKDAMQTSDMLFVCAAGNSGIDMSTSLLYPAAFDLPNIISVAALDNKGDLATFSNYGSKVDIAAPGVNILSTIPANGFSTVSGTSPAAAYVTGTAALLLSYDNNLSQEEIKTGILQNVKPLSQLSGQVNTGGMVNAYNALMAQLPTLSMSIITPGDGTIFNLNQSISVSAAGENCHHIKAFIKGPNDTEYIYKDDSYTLGNNITYDFTPDIIGTYSIKVKGYDLEDEEDPNIIVAEANVSVEVLDGIPEVRPATTITTNYTLTEDVAYQSLTITGGTFDLNGYRAYVLGDLIQPAGTLYINNGTLDIEGDYKIQSISGGNSSGYLKMIGTSDKVIVGGNFIMDSSNSHSTYLTAGVLEVKGNFTQKSSYLYNSDCSYNFNTTGTHKVILSGSNLQTISFEDCPKSGFNVLESTNNIQGMNCSTPIAIFSLQSNLKVQDLIIGGSTDLAGNTVVVTGSLIQPGGILNINNGTLEIKGDYKIQSISGGYSIGSLKMTGILDKVIVGGNFIMDSSNSHEPYLTAGVLEVKGNFTQKSSNTYSYTPLNFKATGTHKVLLSGSNLQTVSFEDYNNSRFNILVTTKSIDTGYSFNHQPVWISLMRMEDDIEAPTTPTGLTATSKTSSSVSLSWTRSIDNIVVSGYKIIRDGITVSETVYNEFTDEGLSPDTTYTYEVQAYDGNGNMSSLSGAITVATEHETNNTFPLTWPTFSKEVTLRFGEIDDFYNATHTGTDIQGTAGSDVVSAVNGQVVYAGYNGDYGNVVYINANYDGKNIQIRCAHLQDYSVSEGTIIYAGTVIGRMGSTGNASGTHLHFEVLESTDGNVCRTDGANAVRKDPLTYFANVNRDDSYMSSPFSIGKVQNDTFDFDSTYGTSSVTDSVYGSVYDDGIGTMSYSTMGLLDNVRYILNWDLEDGQAYLRKLVEKYAWERASVKKSELESRNILTYDASTGIVTVNLNSITKQYSVQLGNAIGKNGRLIVNAQEFYNYFYQGVGGATSEENFLDKVVNWFTYDPSSIAGSYGYLNRVGQNSSEATLFFQDNWGEWLFGGYANEKMEEARVSLFRQGILKSDSFYNEVLEAQMEYWKEYDAPTWSSTIATAGGLAIGEIIRVGVVNTILNRMAARQSSTIVKKELENSVLQLERSGSALKVDYVNPIRDGKNIILKEFPLTPIEHGFTDIIDNYAGQAQVFQINNGTLYQIEGSLNGVNGRFEWIIDNTIGNVTHRMFIINGTINGKVIIP